MSYKLSIVDKKNSLTMNLRYENLAKKKKPEIVAKTTDGTPVRERLCVEGAPLLPGTTTRRWVDDQGKVYDKSTLKFYYGEQEVSEIEQTKVFEVEGFQPLAGYTDKYVISQYYELSPDDNGMKKDHDREVAKNANLSQMHKLWKYLYDNKLVARGEFCPSSRGFLASDAYIRAIQINGNKWGLELGVFKEEKIFQHLNEGEPDAVVAVETSKGKKIKNV